MFENESAVDAGQETIVESQTEISADVAEQPEVTEQTEQNEQEPMDESAKEEVATPQSKEENSKFAEIRREYEAKAKEAEARAKDALIAEMYGEQGINTYADYKAALDRQRFEEQLEDLTDRGLDPEIAKEVIETRALKAKMAEDEAKQAEMAEFSATFPGVDMSNLPSEVWEAIVKGRDMTSAYAIHVAKNIDKVKIAAQQETLKSLKTNQETSTGSVNSNSTEENNMSNDQVNSLLKSMSSSEQSKWIDKNMKNLEKWGYFKNY